tara:strand:+ start:66 stop:353 length:288 start_codon:yes stop_codon:yes gene_type:complete
MTLKLLKEKEMEKKYYFKEQDKSLKRWKKVMITRRIKSFIKKHSNSYSVIELGLIEYYLKLDNYERVKDLLSSMEFEESRGLKKQYIELLELLSN